MKHLGLGATWRHPAYLGMIAKTIQDKSANNCTGRAEMRVANGRTIYAGGPGLFRSCSGDEHIKPAGWSLLDGREDMTKEPFDMDV